MDVKPVSVVLIIILVVPITLTLIKILNTVWFRPKKLERLLRKQGVHGNKYRPLIGDIIDFISVMKAQQLKTMELSNDITTHIFPYYTSIMNMYGSRSFVWFGPFPRLNISEPELIKEILTKSDVFHKPHPDPVADKIVGGIFNLENEKWAKHRKIINPAFHLQKLKNMVPAMLVSCSNMLEKWEALISSSGNYSKEIDVLPYLDHLSVETISRAAFGNSHEEGKVIFELQKEEVNLVLQVATFNFIAGWRYFPTKTNRRIDVITKEIESLIRGIIDRRERAKERGEIIDDDLLESLIGSNSSKDQGGMSINEVIEECKLFYFAGSETTSNLLAWTMVLLGKHPDWQARAREEVSRVFGNNEPNFDGLHQLKTVRNHDFERGSKVVPTGTFDSSSPYKERQVRGHDFTGRGAVDAANRATPSRSRGLGRRRQGIQPAEVYPRYEEPILIHTVQLGPASLYRAKLCDDGGETGVGDDCATILVRVVVFVFARSLLHIDSPAPVWCYSGFI